MSAKRKILVSVFGNVPKLRMRDTSQARNFMPRRAYRPTFLKSGNAHVRTWMWRFTYQDPSVTQLAQVNRGWVEGVWRSFPGLPLPTPRFAELLQYYVDLTVLYRVDIVTAASSSVRTPNDNRYASIDGNRCRVRLKGRRRPLSITCILHLLLRIYHLALCKININSLTR